MTFTTDGHPNDELLSAYLVGAIEDGSTRAMVEHHLAGCPTCREHIAQLQLIRALLSELPAPALPRSFTLTRDELQRLRRRPWYLRYQPVFRRLSAVAAVLLIVLFAVELLAPTGAPRSVSEGHAEQAATPVTAETPVSVMSAPAAAEPPGTADASPALSEQAPAASGTPEVAVAAAPSPQPGGAPAADTAQEKAAPASSGVSLLDLAVAVTAAILVVALLLAFLLPAAAARHAR